MIHPLDSLATRYGDRGAGALLAVAVGVPVVLLGPDHVASPMLIGLGVVVYATSDGLDLGTADREEVEEALLLYRHGDLSLEEFETRLDVLLDDESQQIRGLAETVDRVGPATSARLALAYETPEAFRRATPADLRKVHGIDRDEAERLATRVGESSEVVETETGDPLATMS